MFYFSARVQGKVLNAGEELSQLSVTVVYSDTTIGDKACGKICASVFSTFKIPSSGNVHNCIFGFSAYHFTSVAHLDDIYGKFDAKCKVGKAPLFFHTPVFHKLSTYVFYHLVVRVHDQTNITCSIYGNQAVQHGVTVSLLSVCKRRRVNYCRWNIFPNA